MGFKVSGKGKLTELTTGSKKVKSSKGKKQEVWETEKVDLTKKSEKTENE